MPNENLIRSLDGKTSESMVPPKSLIVMISVALILGIVGGFVLSRTNISSSIPAAKKFTGPVDKVAGIKDKKTFKDQAEGLVKEGGIEGEGNFHLIRPGGAAQNVYLTSTTVDLTPYIDKKVRVWGETFKAEKAGWLMDVGLVEVL